MAAGSKKRPPDDNDLRIMCHAVGRSGCAKAFGVQARTVSRWIEAATERDPTWDDRNEYAKTVVAAVTAGPERVKQRSEEVIDRMFDKLIAILDYKLIDPKTMNDQARWIIEALSGPFKIAPEFTADDPALSHTDLLDRVRTATKSARAKFKAATGSTLYDDTKRSNGKAVVPPSA